MGTKIISTVVTAQDGTTNTYTVAVTRPYNIATLSGLVLSSGTLSPAFTAATKTYTATVPNATTSITVRPTATQANATIKVNGTTVASGTTSAAIPLAVGSNTITTVVTAQDGTTTSAYTVTVTRQSNIATLSNLTLSVGTLNPAFASGTTGYTAGVTNATTSVKITATVTQANATIKVNGITVASGVGSTAITLAVGTKIISTVVTAQDGTTNTYTVTVTRPSNVVGTLTPQETWRQTYFNNIDDGADLYDYDKDGVVNLLEYAFGLNPGKSDQGEKPWRMQQVGNDSVITFTQPAGVSGITYSAEWSQTMKPGEWYPVDDTGEFPQHTFSVPNESNGILFMRVNVTSP